MQQTEHRKMLQWYWPFFAGIAVAQLTEEGLLADFFKVVLPPSMYACAGVVLHVTKLVCASVASSCKRNCYTRTKPSAPPRTFVFAKEEDVAKEVSEDLTSDLVPDNVPDLVPDSVPDLVEDSVPEEIPGLKAEVPKENEKDVETEEEKEE